MADKIIKTRVQNRTDTLANWQADSATTLLKGEIAVVSVTTTQTDEQGNIVQVPAYLIKIGDGTTAFGDLPWLSGPAADVYDWAKGQTAEGVNIGVKVGSATSNTTKTLGTWIKALQDANDTQSGKISALEGKVDVTKVSTAISSAINALDSTSSGTGTIVKAVTQTDGKVAVTMGTLSASEIPSLPASKITTGDSTYTTLDAMLGNINSKLASVNTDVLGGLDVTDAQATTDSSTASSATKFVSKVTQTDGKISVTKRALTLTDIPSITTAKIADANVTAAKLASNAVTTAKIADGAVTDAKINTVAASKVIVTAGTDPETLSEKLTSVDGKISALEGRNNGHTDSAINSMIDTKINALNVSAPSASGTGTAFITSVSQSNGKISATKANLPTAGTSTAGIVKLGVANGAATYEVAAQNASDISDLKAAVAGGVHFIGVTTTALSDGATTSSITIDGATKTPSAGDVVLYSTKEYIWTGSAWKELGDQGRIANLETKINNLDVTDTATTNNFVTAVNQVDGKISVSRARPTSANISHGDSDLNTFVTAEAAKVAALEGLVGTTKVSTAITNAIGALDVSEPAASGTSTSFIATAKQTDGKIVVTKKNLPTASSSTAGIMKLGATGGAATYSDFVTLRDTTVAGIASRVSAVEGDYVRFNSSDNKLYVGKTGTDTIIFDCGGASL